MAPEAYWATLLTELPATTQRPVSMAAFRAYAPFATDGPLEIKVVYHLPACNDTAEYIAIVKEALQIMPGKYVDVLYSPPAHWAARHPDLHQGDVVAHLHSHGAPPLAVLRHMIRPAGLSPPAIWGLI